MRIVPIFALVAGIMAGVAPVAAQETTQPSVPPQPTQEEVQTAIQHYLIIAGALQSEQLAESVKAQLFMCLYMLPMRQISENVTQAIEANSELSADDPEHVQAVVGAVCGVEQSATTAE